MSSRCAHLGLAATVAALVAGCGGSDGASEEEIARERADAAAQARQQERISQLEQTLKEQEKADEKAQGEPSSDTPAPSSAPATGGGTTSCGSDLSVGPSTSCPFAFNVRDEYFASGQSSQISVYSPTTGTTYTMSCTGGSPHICTGGNNASVYFP